MSNSNAQSNDSPASPEPGSITWAVLIELEPRLLDLYRRAKGIRDDKRKTSFCANAVWYGRRGWPGLKPVLYRLVGYGAPKDAHPLLRISAAYDVASRTIYNALPDCRGCVCWGFHEYIFGAEER